VDPDESHLKNQWQSVSGTLTLRGPVAWKVSPVTARAAAWEENRQETGGPPAISRSFVVYKE